MLGNEFTTGWVYARNTTNRYSVTIDPIVVRGRRVPRDIFVTTALNHVYGLGGFGGAGAHAFISDYTPSFGGKVDLDASKPNYASIDGANIVTFGLRAVRAEGGSLFTIYYQN